MDLFPDSGLPADAPSVAPEDSDTAQDARALDDDSKRDSEGGKVGEGGGGESGIAKKGRGEVHTHALIRMSMKLDALGDTDSEVMSRLGLDPLEFDVLLVRDHEISPATARPSWQQQQQQESKADIGLMIDKSDEGLVVIGFVSGFAATKSGQLSKGDVLLEIDGHYVGDDLAEVQGKLQGAKGTFVTLKMRRSTERVLMIQRRHILSTLLATVKPLRRVMVHVMRTCALQAQLYQKKMHAPAVSLAMFHFNPEAHTGMIGNMQLDPLLCDFLRNYEMRLFGYSSLGVLNASAVNVLSLMPEIESQRTSALDLEYSLQSTVIQYLVEQLELMLTTHAHFRMASISYDDFVYLYRDVVTQDIMKKLNPIRTEFLRRHVPDAISHMLRVEQLTVMMTYRFAINREPQFADKGAAGGGGGSGGLSGAGAGVRPQSGRVDVRRRSRGGRMEVYQDSMFKLSYADLDRLLDLPVSFFLQMGQDPPRSVTAPEIACARVVYGLEKKGGVFVPNQPFCCASLAQPEQDQMQELHLQLAAINAKLEGCAHSQISGHLDGAVDVKKYDENKLLAQRSSISDEMLTIAAKFTVKPLTYSEYCQELENTTGAKSAMPAAVDGYYGEDSEWRDALLEYRRIEQHVKDVVYLGWRRIVMMCEAGADMREWSMFSLNLVQPAFLVFPHWAHLVEQNEELLQQQHVVWDCEARLAKSSEISSNASVPSDAASSDAASRKKEQELRDLQVENVALPLSLMWHVAYDYKLT